jgi:hypothetical protein
MLDGVGQFSEEVKGSKGRGDWSPGDLLSRPWRAMQF